MDTFSHQLDPKIKQTAKKLEMYTQLLKKALPPECENHFSVASVQKKSIVIVANSPVWTTRLRQLGQLILETMKAQSLSVACRAAGSRRNRQRCPAG